MAPIVLPCFRAEWHQAEKRCSLAFGDNIIGVFRLCLGDVDAFTGLGSNG